MSEVPFYDERQYFCPACGACLQIVPRGGGGTVLLHCGAACEFSGKAFIRPTVPLIEIKGRMSEDGRFLPEGWVVT